MLEPEAVTTIVRLGQSGWGAKRIARTLGIARNTVRRYLNAGGPVPYRQPQRTSVLGGHEAWLRKRFLQHRGNCDVVRQQLSKELGIETSLRTVERACRGFRQELEASRRATIRFETAPGEQMQIDFGQTRVLIGGESVRVFLFVACHRPAHWSHRVIGTLRPVRDRHIGASRGSAHRGQRRIGVMEPLPL
jgi:hypothetical protein